ncbi:hypothetical protein [Hydrogenimonas thermophila]|uniref:Uncharacterized protein n=1 Tax=Hydrogenimonas thermophila TaxID=223786 RepID=A0A1I5U284_9BACT|nr:hypothetical protein [Hydrogenimonas thermophila]SFP89394.1 hypothetical protein SAMN05216234_15312 [Hydrogenimonas thermophila]
MTLYDLYRYTPQQIIEVEYLLEQAKRFDIVDRVAEAFFQFSPRLVEDKIEGFGEHEPWAIFHKSLIISELAYYCIDKTVDEEYEREFWYNEQIDKEVFTPFFLKTDFRKLNDQAILTKFSSFLNKLKLELE